ncbi:hypothetical protein MBLNU459_g0317t1 [Dothideomycetes sp. NU459]
MPTLAHATRVQSAGSHTYTANFFDEYCIGAVPHGGYVTSCFQKVASAHFASTLSKQNQPHTITMHLEFLRRTEVGLATFTVKDAKVGRTTSTIHVTLTQGGREEVVAYITNSNLEKEAGVSFGTDWALEPPPPKADLKALARGGGDDVWLEQKAMPFAAFRKASQRIRFYFPRKGQALKSLADQWMCFNNGEKFTNDTLGFVVDMFPQIIESYRLGKDPYTVDPRQQQPDQEQEQNAKRKGFSAFWYPTLLLNLDVKKALPQEGVQFLFVRTRAKRIQNGRYDLEIVVMDEVGDVVALSHHVCMVLSAERNLAKRDKTDKEASKL